MRSLTQLLFTAALVGGTLASASALASPGPEVRDHRGETVAPSVESGPHYRHRPGPRFMLPLRVDLGAAGISTSRGYAPGIAASVGIHWASLSPHPTDTDVGLGVFGALLGAPASDTMMTDNGIAYGGAYLEVGHTLARGSFWRTWASGRGEYLAASAFGADRTGFGATGRLSAELYVSGVGIEPRGIFLGTYALGVYVEAGARQMPSGVSPVHLGGGLTFSTPLVFAP